jgi:hypothetical protein
MNDRGNAQGRLQVVKGKLRAYEGQLEGRLRGLRGQAEHATGRARVHWGRAERQVRQAIDISFQHLGRAMSRLEPGVQRALHQTRALQAGLRAGLKAGAAKYREARRK